MRGEHSRWPSHCGSGYGSSPHARGTHGIDQFSRVAIRIIPACAGNTPIDPQHRPRSTDHPRMRGEHNHGLAGDVSPAGSSPHARGTPVEESRDERHVRIIPACAGNTFPAPSLYRMPPDHPRMRGEHRGWRPAAARRIGSSPHARGTRTVRGARGDNRRIIPACAGNTDVIAGQYGSVADHPRMRGEHYSDRHNIPPKHGSSPHARGTHSRSPTRESGHRIIPACAGNTRPDTNYRMYIPDHPRMRGEHYMPRTAFRSTHGSSPHARGTPVRDRAQRHRGRIIPACAGNTGTQWVRSGGMTDHPRMRGEHTKYTGLILVGNGSSPHARGTQSACPHGQGCSRIIPACAGNTAVA